MSPADEQIAVESLIACRSRASAAMKEIRYALHQLEMLPHDLGADALNDPVARAKRGMLEAFFQTYEAEFHGERGLPLDAAEVQNLDHDGGTPYSHLSLETRD